MESEARVIAIDRWGRFLLLDGAVPGGPIGPDESPDAAAIRLFEDATGFVLEQLRLYRVSEGTGRRVHVYYDDADIDAEILPADIGAHYRAPGGLADPAVDGATRDLLEGFAASGAYRALFH